MTKQKAKQQRWFRDGADALSRAVARYPSVETQGLTRRDGEYPCPLCLELFPIEAVADNRLTVEHVPPECLGGGEVLLTCARCNNESGRAFDAEPGKLDLLRTLAEGTHRSAVTARFALNGVAANGDLIITNTDQPHPPSDFGISLLPQKGGGIHFSPVAKINDPANLALFNGALTDTASMSLEVSFAPRIRVARQLASASWIRAAYLAAFAVFGWSYALRSVFTPLRAQLKAGRAATLPELHYETEGADRRRREIIVCEDPGQTRCVVVAMGPHVVFLPPLGGGLTLTDVAADVKQRGSVFTGIANDWPAQPRYELDRLPV